MIRCGVVLANCISVELSSFPIFGSALPSTVGIFEFAWRAVYHGDFIDDGITAAKYFVVVTTCCYADIFKYILLFTGLLTGQKLVIVSSRTLDFARHVLATIEV